MASSALKSPIFFIGNEEEKEKEFNKDDPEPIYEKKKTIFIFSLYPYSCIQISIEPIRNLAPALRDVLK